MYHLSLSCTAAVRPLGFVPRLSFSLRWWDDLSFTNQLN